MHYARGVNDLSVKGAHRTFRQFLPDFSHTGRRRCLCMSSARLFQKERILHETENAVYSMEEPAVPALAPLLFQQPEGKGQALLLCLRA